jgi:hypothetical protein
VSRAHNLDQSTAPTERSWFLLYSLTWNWLIVFPPFSTALRISARKEMGEGCALAKTYTWFVAMRSCAMSTFSEPLMTK